MSRSTGFTVGMGLNNLDWNTVAGDYCMLPAANNFQKIRKHYRWIPKDSILDQDPTGRCRQGAERWLDTAQARCSGSIRRNYMNICLRLLRPTPHRACTIVAHCTGIDRERFFWDTRGRRAVCWHKGEKKTSRFHFHRCGRSRCLDWFAHCHSRHRLMQGRGCCHYRSPQRRAGVGIIHVFAWYPGLWQSAFAD